MVWEIWNKYKTGECGIWVCKRRAQIRGYCAEHYDKMIEPPQHLTKDRLLEFMHIVRDMLITEYGVDLPRNLVPASVHDVSKIDLRERYKRLCKLVDSRYSRRLWTYERKNGLGEFAKPDGVSWERLCLRIAQVLYGEVLYHPRLPNGSIPDFVPVLQGIQSTTSRSGSVQVSFAPLIVEAKYSLLAPEVRQKYRRYCKRVEVWLFRWKPNWLQYRRPSNRIVVYVPASDLAKRVAKKGDADLARLLRCLPILWGTWEIVGHYAEGFSRR